MADWPDIALSVRQPWAWAIIHGGKDIENRSWQAVNHGLSVRGSVAIHAAKGMTRSEYETAAGFMRGIGVQCPAPATLLRGGIIGWVDVVKESKNPWFFGPMGLVLSNPVACQFVPVAGALGYFKWNPGPPENVPTPAKWMLDHNLDLAAHEAPQPPSLPLFADES